MNREPARPSRARAERVVVDPRLRVTALKGGALRLHNVGTGRVVEVPRRQVPAMNRLLGLVCAPRERHELRSLPLGEASLDDLVVPADATDGSVQAELYESFPELLPGAEMVFMNHGYLGRGDDFAWLHPSDAGQKYSVNLVRRVVRGVDFGGKTVVDAGCGRGGACSYLVRYERPRRVIGLDFSAANVAFCRRVHVHDDLTFVRGDAQAMAFDSGSIDVVCSVESSHCFPSAARFYAEAGRVLKRGGLLVYADITVRPKEREYWLRRCGFRVRRRADLRSGVARALRANATTMERQLRAMARGAEGVALAERLLGWFAADAARYESKQLGYGAWILEKE